MSDLPQSEIKQTSQPATAPTEHTANSLQTEGATKPELKEVVAETSSKLGQAESPAEIAVSSNEAVTTPVETSQTAPLISEQSAASESSGENFTNTVRQLVSELERIPVQIYNEETPLQKLSHWGPVLTGAVSIVLAFVVWVNTQELTSLQLELQKQQVELQNHQTRLQSEQVEAELADLRFKFLADLTATDENKKTPAEIGLASHGLKAFPVVHYALGVEQGDIRRSAVNVVYRMFQAESNDGRETLLTRLMGEFTSPNKTLHTGVVQSFVKIEPLLKPEQRKNVLGFLNQNVNPVTACLEQDGRETVFEAAKFIGSKSTDAIPYLLSIATVARCGDAWLQAMYNLQSIAGEVQTDDRAALRQKVEQVKAGVLEQLPKNITEQELTTGYGFAGFVKPGEVGMELDDVKKRIEKEFDALIVQLS